MQQGYFFSVVEAFLVPRKGGFCQDMRSLRSSRSFRFSDPSWFPATFLVVGARCRMGHGQSSSAQSFRERRRTSVSSRSVCLDYLACHGPGGLRRRFRLCRFSAWLQASSRRFFRRRVRRRLSCHSRHDRIFRHRRGISCRFVRGAILYLDRMLANEHLRHAERGFFK